MKLVAISHFRCDEREKTEFYVIPDDMSYEDAGEYVKAARVEYMAKYNEFETLGMKPKHLNINDFLDKGHMTIAEAIVSIELNNLKLKEYNKKKDDTIGSFSRYLISKKIVPLRNVDFPEEQSFELDWYHNHGKDLKY